MPRLREGANLYANSVIALDARTGRLRDHVQVLDGRLILLDALTGQVAHEVNTGAPIGAGVVTYEVGGRQYIAVAGGSTHRSGRCRRQRAA